MNSDVIFSFIRQGLQIAGTYLATKGVIDGGTAETLVGALMSLISVGWSWVFHKKPTA